MMDPCQQHLSRTVLRDDHTALVTPAQFKALLEYSFSLPTGKYIGKVWKCLCKGGWFLGEYVEDPDPTMIGIKWRELIVVDGDPG